MAARTAAAPKSAQKVQRELEDLQLVMKARNGSSEALDGLIRFWLKVVVSNYKSKKEVEYASTF